MKLPFLHALACEFTFQITQDNLSVRAKQLHARLHLYPVMILSQMLLESLFVWLFWALVEAVYLLAWLTAFYILQAVDLGLWWRHRKQTNTVQKCRWWSRNFKLFTFFTASMWALVSIFFFPADLTAQILLICLVLGLVAGAVSFDSVYPPSLYIFVVIVSVPLFVRLAMVGSETHWILSGMFLLFVLGSVSAGRELGRNFWKSLWQRYENDQLIIQLKEQKALAETANRDKSRFLAAASHDLRQPLQALVLFSDAINVIAKKNETRHLAMQIGKSVDQLVNMFDELLDISKFDAGLVQAKKYHFRLQDLFDRLHSDFSPLAQVKNLKLFVQHTNLSGYSDALLVERILRNLISNAIKYTHAGEVTVSCQGLDTLLQITVLDTGIGIDAENMLHIFEEYYQVANQHRDHGLGLGLGLAIVRRLEALLGCQVSVVSEINRGSAFSFNIPQGDASQLMQPLNPQRLDQDLMGVNVAVVEDNVDIRLMIVKLLQQWGCHTHDSELPHELLAKMASAGIRPDILICDYRLLQGVSAIDVIKQMHERWDKHIPSLVLTGDTAPQTLQEIKASGALLLHKPITPARLRSIMYFALHNDHRAATELSAQSHRE